MRYLYLLAVALVGSLGLLVVAPPGAAQAAVMGDPLGIPFIGEGGVRYTEDPNGGTKSATVKSIFTGKEIRGQVPRAQLGGLGMWSMLGIGLGGDLTGDPDYGTEAMCAKAGTDDRIAGLCGSYFESNGIQGQEAMFDDGSVPGEPNGKPAGWSALPKWNDLRWGGQGTTAVPYGQGTFTTSIVSAPAFGAAGQISLTITSNLSGRCENDGWVSPDTTYQLFARRTSTGVVAGYQGGTLTDGADDIGYPGCKSTATRTLNFTLPVGYTFEHLTTSVSGRTYSTGNFHTGPAIPWYPEGHTLWTPGSDPEAITGMWEIQVVCINGDETQTITSTQQVVVKPGEPFALPDAVCPPGWIAIDVGQDWTPDGGEKQEIVPKGNATGPSEEEIIRQIPACFNGERTDCVLELKEKQGELWVSCGSIGQLCPDWAKHPNAPSQYQCYYGGLLVNLNTCSAYRAPQIGVLPNMKPDGTPIPYTAPVPGSIGGSPLPGTVPDPRAVCAESKPPSFWEGFSPYWIYESARCAMVEVFVPRPAVVEASMAKTATAWKATPPGLILEYVESIADSAPSASGCSGPPVNFAVDLPPINVAYSGYPLSACAEPMATLANVARTIGGFVMVFAAFTAITRYAGAVVNAPQLGGN